MMSLAVAKVALVSNKLGLAIASMLGLIDLAWGTALVAQVTSEGIGAETIVPAGLTTMVTAALIWVFRKMAAGEIVHRDPQKANDALARKLTEASEALKTAAEAMVKFSEAQQQVMTLITRLEIKRQGDG